MTEPAPQYHSLAGAMPIRLATVTEAQWTSTAEAFAAAGNPLVALWGSDRRSVAEGFVVWASYATHDGLAIVRLQVQGAPPEYPALKCYPSATRMQRALFDLLGVRARDAADQRPWLRHAAWPVDFFPLRHRTDAVPIFEQQQEHYPFVSVAGDGVHEIAVGPIHAGVIEPGHFRFSVVGEKVLRLGTATRVRAQGH